MSGPQLDTRKLSDECHEEVTRQGELQPCEKPAVAVRIDPNEGSPYAVCAYHARAEMVPLGVVLAAALGAAVTPTPQETCRHGKTEPHDVIVEGFPVPPWYRCPGRPVTSTPEAAATVAEKMAVKATEVAAMSRWSYREALDAPMAAAGYFPTPEAATERPGQPGKTGGEGAGLPDANAYDSPPSPPSGLQRATEQQRRKQNEWCRLGRAGCCGNRLTCDCVCHPWSSFHDAVGGSDTPADQPAKDAAYLRARAATDRKNGYHSVAQRLDEIADRLAARPAPADQPGQGRGFAQPERNNEQTQTLFGNCAPMQSLVSPDQGEKP